MKNIIKKIKFKFIVIYYLLFIIYYLPVSAADLGDYVDPLNIRNNGNFQSSVAGLAWNFINTLFGVLGLVVLVMFVIAGVLYIGARGESKKVQDANKIMKWSVIGVAIVFFSYIIVNFIFTQIKQFK